MKGTRIVKLLSIIILFVLTFGVVIPALADYLGPDRTRTESYVETYDWGVWAKDDPGYPDNPICHHTYGTDCVVCTWERDPGSPCGDAEYWYKVGTRSEVVDRTVIYPVATISGTLTGCNARNGWCSTAPMLSLSASEPVAGYQITLIEGTRNGEAFACNGASCDIPLLEGGNTFTFWALSSWGDSSRMGSLTARVDTQPPQINGTMSGTTGENGWYISPITFSVSTSDPAPGSGIETLTYSLDGGAWTPYTATITVSDGAHTITFRAQDLAGHISETSASVQVDTLPPQLDATLSGEQANGWYLTQVTFTASASDSGSGMGRIEYAIDGGNWQPYHAPVTIGDGEHSLRLRALDAAGNVTEHTPLTFQVDSMPPRIQLPESWYIWENSEVKVSDGQSGLSSVEIEIRDPQGRWRKVIRANDANGQPFSTNIAWDRRFGDGTLAPIGTYQVVVKASDRAGNFTQETASLYIPAPNAPTYTPAPTRTPLPTFTATPDTSQVAADAPTITPTRTPVVSAFGAFPTPILDSQSPIPQSANSQSSVLWGAAALAAIGAATAYALEQRRKRKEEEARQAAEAQTEAARRNAVEEARKAQNWLQGKAMLEAQLQEVEKAGASQEQIAALRQTGLTKGFGTALAATTVAIRLLIEKNRAQSQNPQPSSSGGGGKVLASLVPHPYPAALMPADDEPPTFWDKLKQLWNTFWNWVTGKPAMPAPTAIPPVASPTSTSTPLPTSTTVPTPTTIPTSTRTPTPTPTFQPLPGGYARYSPYWYGKTYFDILNSDTDGWWHSYQGQPFGMKTYLAAVYNYEIASFANDPLVREYFTEAFARRYWQSQIDYGADGAFWYLGGRDMVRLRVLNNIPGINVVDYNFAQSFEEAERILNNPAWQQGISWSSPYDWGNPTEKTRDLLPLFWKTLQSGATGTQGNQILYISPLKDFFVITQEQVYQLCGNQSCVNPSNVYP